MLQSTETRQEYDDLKRDILEARRLHAILAVENGRLREEVDARTRELAEALQQQTAAADVLKVISSSAFDLQALLDTLVGSAARLCEADQACVFQRKGDLYHWVSNFGFSPDLVAYASDHPFAAGPHSTTSRVAHDGVDALATLASNPDITMVLSDINMPRMDGLTLLARLQEADDRPCTVIVSAYGDMSNIRTAMNGGAFDFVTKPIDFADLEATIGKSIRHVEALRESRRRQFHAERAHASLSRYFSPNLAERLAGDPSGLDLGGARREVASLFTDVAGFTTLVESLDPSVLAEILNDYLSEMTGIVFAHEGTVARA